MVHFFVRQLFSPPGAGTGGENKLQSGHDARIFSLLHSVFFLCWTENINPRSMNSNITPIRGVKPGDPCPIPACRGFWPWQGRGTLVAEWTKLTCTRCGCQWLNRPDEESAHLRTKL
eukprot:gb/GEZN01026275.1/.p3 GENE.gb/GEZN01026275.1/~~gb/GEZN01026275.1/.p3  ORF type:complete len:117 (-),score=0.96 gb/GEZN01026275.1/:119-469(-)